MSRLLNIKLFIHLTVIVLTVIVSSCGNPQAQTGGEEMEYPPAPDFQLLSLAGEEIQLSDYRGKLLLLNFWSSWCEFCKEELPILQNIQDQYADDLQVIAVNLTYQDDRKAVNRFVQEHQLEYPIALDRFGEVSKAYDVLALPVLYVISAQGELLKQIHGQPGEDALIKEIETWIN